MDAVINNQVKKFNHDYFIFFLYVIHIVLNFMGTPILKYFFLFETVCFFYLAFTKNWKDLLFTTFTFLLIEGQGRILGNYNLISKNLFDIYLIIILMKSFIRNKKFFSFKRVPLFIYALIVGHFIWYGVQFFNYQSVGPLGALFSTKIYIFPILFFFLFLNDELDFKQYNTNKFTFLILALLILQSYLIIFQKEWGDTHLLNIHPHYKRVMRDIFIDNLFRPFGTSHLPGGISVYIPYFMSLIYFFKPSSHLLKIMKVFTIVLLLFCCFIMQVRTGFLQLALIIFLSSIYLSLTSKFKYFLVPSIISILFFIPTVLSNLEPLDDAFPELNLGISIQRFQDLQDKDKVLNQRSGIDLFALTLKQKLTTTPMGLGPGRTGAANIPFSTKIESDLAFDKSYSWTLDNLFISLAIDFGYGMIFYALLVTLFPLFLMGSTILLYLKHRKVVPVLGSSAIATCVILASAWGAISIPYNPISFFYWFFCASGLLALRDAKLSL